MTRGVKNPNCPWPGCKLPKAAGSSNLCSEHKNQYGREYYHNQLIKPTAKRFGTGVVNKSERHKWTESEQRLIMGGMREVAEKRRCERLATINIG